jgi:hypothetical protein
MLRSDASALSGVTSLGRAETPHLDPIAFPLKGRACRERAVAFGARDYRRRAQTRLSVALFPAAGSSDDWQCQKVALAWAATQIAAASYEGGNFRQTRLGMQSTCNVRPPLAASG